MFHHQAISANTHNSMHANATPAPCAPQSTRVRFGYRQPPRDRACNAIQVHNHLTVQGLPQSL
eukprot:4357287-Amphidinium_carterae.1